jgi:hypothetical protein
MKFFPVAFSVKTTIPNLIKVRSVLLEVKHPNGKKQTADIYLHYGLILCMISAKINKERKKRKIFKVFITYYISQMNQSLVFHILKAWNSESTMSGST